MQRIAEIISESGASRNGREDLLSPSELQTGFIYSDTEAAQGVTNPPPKIRCEYCGKPRIYKGFYCGGVLMWSPFPEPCKCPEGKAKYEREKAEGAARDEAERKEREAQELRKRVERIIRLSGMGARFLNKTFETLQITPENKQAIQTARRYADSFEAMLPRRDSPEPGRNGLFIVGPPGTGKTHLAAAIANKIISEGQPVICMTMIDMLEKIRRTFNGEGSEAEVIHRLKTVPLLIVDDIGKEPPTEWAISTVYNIINGRYEAYLPTIVTSNYAGKELEARMTPKETKDSMTARATLDRIAEMCRAIGLAGESWRRK